MRRTLDALKYRARLLGCAQRGAPHAKVQAGQVHRHIDLQAERELGSLALGNTFDTLYMLNAIHHQRHGRPCCSHLSDRDEVLIVPGGIADQEIVEALRGEEGCFARGVTHNTLKARVGFQNAAYHGNAAQRLGGEAHALFTRARQYLPDILGEQIEIEIRKWHGATREDLPIIGIVAALFMDRWGDQGCSSANAITASIRSSSSHTLESSIWGGDEPVKVAHRPLTSEHLLIS